jgi:ATP/maltotriose-dependent transcriptional regulator MalT
MVTHLAKQVATGAGRPAVADPILASKITVPDVPGFAVQRPRISELLAGGTGWNPLTIVTGPPGTGKTMALTLWAAAENRPVAWVALDRYDNRPESFWSYVVAALRRSGTVLPEALSADTREQATDHVFLLWLVSALAGQDLPLILVGTVAWLVAAHVGLADGRADVTAQCVAKARSGWCVPDWLEQKLTQVESQACLAAGRVQAALAIAERMNRDSSLEAAIMHARAWAAAGDTSSARRALSPALAAHHGAAEQVQLQAWLVDAQLSYNSGNRVRGHRSLTSALRLAEREQLRLPFVLERGWIQQALERDAELARSYQRLLAPTLRRGQLPASLNAPTADQPAIVVVEPLTEREREVLRHVSDMLNTAEVASEMYISINTVKSHLKSIFRKLAATHRGEAVRRAQQLELI